MTDKEVMQIALETAEQIAIADYRHWEELASLGEFERWARSRANHIAEALRARLAQPEPEPVAWADKVDIDRDGHDLWVSRQKPAKDGVPLYTAPPQREFIVLTDREIMDACSAVWASHPVEVGNVVQDLLKDRNT